MAVVFTAHAIASINSAKHVAGQLGRSLDRWSLLVVLNRYWHNFGCLSGFEHFMDGIEGSWTVITYQHRRAPSIILRQNLSATSRATMCIELAQLLITQILVTFRMTRSDWCRSFRLTQSLQALRFVIFSLGMGILSGRIAASTVVSKNRQTPMMCETHKGTAASRLTLVVHITERPVASVIITPNFAM